MCNLHDNFRYDEMGVPFTVVVNDATIDTGAISLRSRDTLIYVSYMPDSKQKPYELNYMQS